MSKKKEKQYTVVSIGKPSIENLTDTEARVFYNSLLSCILQKQINNKKRKRGKLKTKRKGEDFMNSIIEGVSYIISKSFLLGNLG